MRIPAEHDPAGTALTMRAVSLYAMSEALATLDLPTLVIAGDEDERAPQPGLMLKRTLPRSGLAVLPGPATSPISKSRSCNRLVERFPSQVDDG